MKKVSIILTLAVVGLVTSCGLMGPKDKRLKFNDPIQYNDYIIDIINDLDGEYSDIMEEEDEDASKVLVDSFAAHTTQSVAKLKNLQPFKKDSTFRDAAAEFVGHLDKISHKELPEFMAIIFSDDILSEKSQSRLDELMPILSDQRIKLFDNTVKVQKAFAVKHKYKIENQ